MAATRDTVGGATVTSANNVQVTSFSTSGAGRLIVVFLSSTAAPATGVTSPGLTFTPIPSLSDGNTFDVWAAVASTQLTNVTITATYGTTQNTIVASVISIAGVRTTGLSGESAFTNNINATIGSATAPSSSMTAQSKNGLILYGVYIPSATITIAAGSGQTKQQENSAGAGVNARKIALITQDTATSRGTLFSNTATLGSASASNFLQLEIISNDAGMVFKGEASDTSTNAGTTASSIAATIGTHVANGATNTPNLMYEIPIGSFVGIVTTNSNNSATVASIADANGNVFTVSNSSNSNGRNEIWICERTTAKMTHGSNVTATWTGTASRVSVSIFVCYGLRASGSQDASTIATATGTAVSSGTAFASQANDIAIGLMVATTSTGTFSNGTGWRNIVGRILPQGGSGQNVYASFLYTSGTGAYSFTGTLTSSQTWFATMTLYKEDGTSINTATGSSSGTGTITGSAPSGSTVSAYYTPTTGGDPTSTTPIPGIAPLGGTAIADSSGVYTITIPGLIPGVTYTVGVYVLDGSGNILSSAFITFTVSALIVKKRYYYKVYNTALQYITTWSEDVVSDPSFRMIINGGAGELIVKLGRKFDNYGARFDIVLNYRVELWCMDCDAPNGIKIFTGYISAYSPTIDDEDQYLQVTLLGFATRLSTHILIDQATGDTTIEYSGFDPSDIARDAIDKYHDDGGGDVFYSNSSILPTNSNVDYVFVNNTIQEVIDEVIQLTPDNWFWYVDANGIFNLNYSNIAKADHKLTIGRDIGFMSVNKRLENMVNAVYVIGGGDPSLYNYYERPASIASFGKWVNRIQNGVIVDDNTSDLLAKQKLDRFDEPEYLTTLHVIDNNGENQLQGANIEAFFPGQTIQIVNLSPQPILIIQSITYFKDYIEIQAASRLPEVSKDIESLDDILTTQVQQNLPPLPVIRSV